MRAGADHFIPAQPPGEYLFRQSAKMVMTDAFAEVGCPVQRLQPQAVAYREVLGEGVEKRAADFA